MGIITTRDLDTEGDTEVMRELNSIFTMSYRKVLYTMPMNAEWSYRLYFRDSLLATDCLLVQAGWESSLLSLFVPSLTPSTGAKRAVC